jgi:hypothetical protein
MARNKADQQNIDGSDLFNYPNKRIRNNDGSGNGTPVDESVYGDIHEFFGKVMRDAKEDYNDLPENTTNGYQLYDSMMSLAGKNDLIKTLGKINDNTLSISIKIGSLKQDESILFKSLVDSTNAMQSIRGNDNIIKPLLILGGFSNGQTVRMINNSNNITLVGLYDSQNVPNLATQLTTINNNFLIYAKIMQVFIGGGAMVFWKRPANEIPTGWAEVVDWRGRFPVGMDVNQPEFNVINTNGGSKTRVLVKDNLPNVRLNYTNTRVGVPDNGGGGYDGGRNSFTDSQAQTEPLGISRPVDILNPYRTVLFIEYVG